MRTSFATVAVAALAVGATLVGTGQVAAGQANQERRPGSPEVAPYMELTGVNRDNLEAAVDTGLGAVTAAFVVGKGCTPTWDDGTAVAKNKQVARAIGTAQQRGVQVMVSFGGAGGVELARGCHNLGRLVAAYQSVVDRFSVTSVDFDIEGDAINPVEEKASIHRRFAAIRALQQDNPAIVVSATIGVGLSGLPHDQLAFLRVAKQTGTTIDLVNLMTMDYGGPVDDMGAAATNATQRGLAQLQRLWPSYTYPNVGITPMIGRNDSAQETTSLADAAAIAGFGADNGVGRLAFWSLNRDQQCPGSKARGDCSGVPQQPLDFTRAFLGG